MKRLLLFLLLAFAPQVLAVGPVITTGCTVTWTENPAGENITHYSFYGDGNEDGVFSHMADIAGPPATCAVEMAPLFVQDPQFDGQKWFYMTAVNSGGESPQSVTVGWCLSSAGTDICVDQATAPQGIIVTQTP